MRRYKENKEKLRRRKEEARQRRYAASLAPPAMPPALLNDSLSLVDSSLHTVKKLGKLTEGLPIMMHHDDRHEISPLSDSLLSMNAMLDEEIAAANDGDSPLLSSNIARKCVDELDVLRRPRLSRPLPPSTPTITTEK